MERWPELGPGVCLNLQPRPNNTLTGPRPTRCIAVVLVVSSRFAPAFNISRSDTFSRSTPPRQSNCCPWLLRPCSPRLIAELSMLTGHSQTFHPRRLGGCRAQVPGLEQQAGSQWSRPANQCRPQRLEQRRTGGRRWWRFACPKACATPDALLLDPPARACRTRVCEPRG